MGKIIFILYVWLTTVSNISVVKDITLAGYPISTWIYLMMIFFTLVSVAIQIKNGQKPAIYFLGLSIFVVTILVSILNSQPLKIVLIECGHYFLAIFLVAFIKHYKISVQFLVKVICIASILGCIFSILYAFKIIDIGYETSHSVVRSAYVDGGIGVLSISIAVYFLLNPKVQIRAIYLMSMLCSGAGILILGQSRARILIAISIITFMIFCTLLNRKVGKIIKVLTAFLVLTLLAYIIMPNFIENSLNSVLGRFSVSLSEDGNTTYRIVEMQQQLQIFYNNPFLGGGWGVLVENSMYNHNMYTSLMSLVGIFGMIPFYIWLLYLIKKNNVVFSSSIKGEMVLSMSLLIMVVLLGVASSGLTKIGPIAAMCVIYAIEQENK